MSAALSLPYFSLRRVSIALPATPSPRRAPPRPADGGHDSKSHDNVVVVRQYDGQACINAGDYVPGHEQYVYNNSCILPPTGSNGRDPDLVAPNIGSSPDPCAGTPHGSGALIAYANRYYTLHDNATTRCGQGQEIRVVDLPPPMEAGSSSHALPDGDTIVAWGREKIGL